MSKNRKIMIVGIGLLLAGIISWWLLMKQGEAGGRKMVMVAKGVEYSLEIAKSGQERSRGLSNREELCEKCGMIFVFPYEGILPFWMKDTLIPLDMIWLNKEGRVVDIQGAEVEGKESGKALTIYRNQGPASKVVELNFGQAEKIGLKVGDYVNFKGEL